jgi:hypothetical protein
MGAAGATAVVHKAGRPPALTSPAVRDAGVRPAAGQRAPAARGAGQRSACSGSNQSSRHKA